MAAVLAAGAAFAQEEKPISDEKPITEDPVIPLSAKSGDATMKIQFTVAGLVHLDYKFRRRNETLPYDKEPPTFDMGTADGKISSSDEVIHNLGKGATTFNLVDCSYCNWNETKTVTIEFKPGGSDLSYVTSGNWKWHSDDTRCNGPAIHFVGEKDNKPLEIVEEKRNGVTVELNPTVKSGIGLTVKYPAPHCDPDSQKITDRRGTILGHDPTVDIATFTLEWDQMEVAAGTYTASLSVHFETP